MTAGELHPLMVLTMVPNGYIGLLGVGLALTRTGRLDGLRFSLPKYYLLMGWSPLVAAALGLWIDWRFVPFFAAASILGVLGEILVSAMWRWFFGEPIWTYSYGSVLAGTTSTINLLPWGVGGTMFAIVGGMLRDHLPGSAIAAERTMAVAGAAFGVGLALAWGLRGAVTRGRPPRFTSETFACFCVPIVCTALAVGLWCSPWLAVGMLAFAPVGFVTEYAYGRAMSMFFERPLWTYHRMRIDGGHSSWVTLPLWSLGGLYFWLCAAAFGL